MQKNILIIGAPRCGKTSLARKIAKDKGYSVISLDDIICAFEAMPECGIKHDGKALEVARHFAGFLSKYLVELSEGPNFYGGIKFVIEGTHIDLDKIMPELNRNKYEVIGLLLDDISASELFDGIKANDTEDDWTYWCDDASLREMCDCFVWKNGCFKEEFEKHDIKTYKISSDREQCFTRICTELFD